MNMHIPPIHTALTITGRPVLEWAHADTALPDYWQGHHLPHISIPVHKGMTLKQIRAAMIDEIMYGQVSGSCDVARILQADWLPPIEYKLAEAFTRAAYAAVNRMKPARKGQRKFFMDLEPEQDDYNTVYAYFVLRDRR